MDEGERTLLGVVGLFVTMGWAAIGHLYKLVFGLPQAKEVDELRQRIDQLARDVTKDRVSAARFYGRFHVKDPPDEC